MHLGVDIDNVINYLDEFLAGLVQEYYGIKINPKNWNQYLIEDSFPEIKKEWIHYLFEEVSMKQNRALRGLKADEKAVEHLHELSKYMETSFITSRPEWSRPYTHAWMEAHGLTKFIPHVYFDEKKLDTIKKLGIDLHVEDHPGLALRIANAGVPVLLYQKLWNRDIKHDLIDPVSDWNDVYLKVMGKAAAMHG